MDADTLDYVISQAEHKGMAPDEWTHFQQIRERVAPVLREAWQDRATCDRDVAICNLAFLDGLSAARIASIDGFGLARGGVEKVIERGRKILQRHFGGPGARSRLIDDGQSMAHGPSDDGWRDAEEILDFILGELDETTRTRRMELLSRDPQAREALIRVAAILDAPLNPTLWGHLRQADIPAFHRSLLRKSRNTRSARILIFPRPPRSQFAQALFATAALLLVSLSPLLHWRLPVVELGARSPVASQDFQLQYPSEIASPLRLAQDFSREAPGALRGSGTAVDEEKMLAVEEELILDRSRGADPVATSNAIAHLKLARGNLELAKRNYAISLRHDPLNGEALIGLAVVDYQRAQKTPAADERQALLRHAEETLSKIESSSPYYLQALYNHIEIALALGDVNGAKSLLHRYEELGPDDGWAHALRAAVQAAERG